jgi:hypothetical protein
MVSKKYLIGLRIFTGAAIALRVDSFQDGNTGQTSLKLFCIEFFHGFNNYALSIRLSDALVTI